MSYPFTWEKVEDPQSVILSYKAIKCKEDGLIMPEIFDKCGINKRIYNFEVRDDDIFLITYPKSGTTWSQELIWGLTSGIDPEVKDMNMFIRSPFLEYETIVRSISVPENDQGSYEEKSLKEKCGHHSVEYASRLKSPRVIKSHIPLSHLPPDVLTKAKVVYVARGPRDVAVSYYHHLSNRHLKSGTTLREFFDLFKDGGVLYGDYFKHVNEHWQFRGHENFHFVWYEEMKENIEKAFDGLEKFLGYKLEDDKRKQLMGRSSIESMRERAVGNAANDGEAAWTKKFFRKGITRDWMNHFTTEEEREEIDNWLRNGLKGTDIILYDDYEV